MIAAAVTVSAQFYQHAHSFTYSASGTTITAKCHAEGCKLPNQQATVTLAAPEVSLTYDGEYLVLSFVATLYFEKAE